MEDIMKDYFDLIEQFCGDFESWDDVPDDCWAEEMKNILLESRIEGMFEEDFDLRDIIVAKLKKDIWSDPTLLIAFTDKITEDLQNYYAYGRPYCENGKWSFLIPSK
jgi:hypothetical protein